MQQIWNWHVEQVLETFSVVVGEARGSVIHTNKILGWKEELETISVMTETTIYVLPKGQHDPHYTLQSQIDHLARSARRL